MTEPTRLWTRDTLAQHIEAEALPVSHRTGEPLPSERTMSDSLGVSRSLVREVLRGLEQRGLLEIVPGKGAYARDPSTADAARAMRNVFSAGHVTPRNLVEARAMLETQTAVLAARRATPGDLAAIRRSLEDFDRASGLVAKAIADISFHSLIARASHNPVLSTMFESISPLVFEAILRSLADTGTSGRGSPFHHVVLAALESGDGEAAGDAMSQHIRVAESTYGDDLDERLDHLVADVLRRTYGHTMALEDIVAEALLTYTDHTAGRGEP
jgi:GntR family transcriptional repressor for pyruvate dehydrogenase complex